MNKNKILSLALTVCMLIGMLSVFPLNVSAADASITLATEQPIYAGTTKLSFNISGQVSKSWVAIYHESRTADAVYEDYVDGFGDSATVTFPSNTSARMRYNYWPVNKGITAGKYYAVLFDSGYNRLATSDTFEVVDDPDAPDVPEQPATTAQLADSTVQIGDPVVVNYQNSSNAKDWIAVYKSSGGSYIDWLYTPETNGSITFTKDWTKTKGTYVLRYFENDGQTNKFCEMTLYISGTGMTAEKTEYDLGEAITINYTGSANGKDWIGIYDTNGKYQNDYLYTPNESGSVTFSGRPWQNTRGTYVARYMENDGSSFVFEEITFTVGVPTFSTDKKRYATGEDIVVTYKNSPNAKDWIAVYGEDGKYVGTYEYTPDANGTVTFQSSKHTWMNTPGKYTLKYLYNDSWDNLIGEKTVSIVEPEFVDYDAVYFVKAGGTGDGKTVDTPAGSITAVLKQINADGYTTGDYVGVFVIRSDSGIELKVGTTLDSSTLNEVNMYTDVTHAAKIKYTTYQYDDSLKNYAVLAHNDKVIYQNNCQMMAHGPEEYENIALVDMRADYRNDINAQGWDMSFKNVVRYRLSGGANPPYTLIKNGKTVLQGGSNRGGVGTSGPGGTVTITGADMGGEFNLWFGGYTVAAGQVETFSNDVGFTLNDTAIDTIILASTGSSRTMTYKKNVNLILNNATVNSFGGTQKAVVGGAVQILLNGNSELKSFTANSVAYTEDGRNDVPVYYLTSTETGCSLDVTDTAGVYSVGGGKIAYAQSEDKTHIYYGDKTLSVEPGTYAVSYTDNKDTIAENVEIPVNADKYLVFDKWEDDGNGTMTAVFANKLPTYYVSADGSDDNDGLTPETALASTTKAIELIGSDRAEIYCIGDVTFTDAAHESLIVYESYNGGTLHGANNKISLMGDVEFRVDFTAAQTITTNGYTLTLDGDIDRTQETYVNAGAEGKDQVINLNGKFVYKMVTNAKGQKNGDITININGGILRQLSTGTGVDKDTSYTVGSVTVNLIEGEFWVLNHTDNGPHRASGALQLIFNNDTYNFEQRDLFEGKSYGPYYVKNWNDFTPSGTDGFPKIQFEKGKWIIRSADKDGNYLKYEGDAEGTYRIYGDKTPYYVSNTGLDVYYGTDGKITLPTGTVDVLWTKEFKAEDMPEPSLNQGYKFEGWDDDGNGHMTAIVTNPDFWYVDDNGSDDNDGTAENPFKTIAKAIEMFEGKGGKVYVVSSAVYDADAISEYTGHITIAPADKTAVLTGSNIALKGELTIDGMTLAENMSFTLNGNRLELANVTADGTTLDFAADAKLVLPTLDGATVKITADGADTYLVLNGTNVETVKAASGAKVKILGESAVIGAVENPGNAEFKIILNNGEQSTISGLTDSDTLILSNNENGRIDYAEADGFFSVESSTGKLPVAVSNNGKAVVASTDYVEQETPDTWYKTETYRDYINYRKPLGNTYKKLTEDKALNVVYFGGSVTNGYGSSNAEKYSWRALIGQWLVDNFPNAKVKNINRASGESGSYLGTYRLQRDVIAHKPDLLFLEYSINDKYYGSSYDNTKMQVETIVREVREALPDCDIVMVLVTDKSCIEMNRNGQLHTQAQAHEDIAATYNIPSLHVGRALADTLPEDWGSAWGNYSIDTVHLNDTGNAVYYDVIREFMYNSLFCTAQTGRNTARDALPAVVSEKLFDGDRTSLQPTQATITASEALGGQGFEFNNTYFGLYDYTGFAYTRPDISSNPEFVFEFDGTDLAMYSNFYNESSISVSLDGGDYKTMACSYHSPTKVVEDIESGHHVVRIKPVYGTASGAPKQMCIVILFTRDRTKATVRGTKNMYDGKNTYSLSNIGSGVWNIVYDADTVSDLPISLADESKIFGGWDSDSLTEGATLSATISDVDDYFEYVGAQIRVATQDQTQGLRFVVDKKNSLDDEISIKNYGMVIIPSEFLGDNVSYADYGKENPIVGAEKLHIGSTHTVGNATYNSAEVAANKIFASYADGVRYTTCVTGIQNYGRYYTLKPYVRYTVNGTEYISYGSAFRSSTYDIAKMILDDTDAKEADKAAAQIIVDAVENK